MKWERIRSFLSNHRVGVGLSIGVIGLAVLAAVKLGTIEDPDDHFESAKSFAQESVSSTQTKSLMTGVTNDGMDRIGIKTGLKTYDTPPDDNKAPFDDEHIEIPAELFDYDAELEERELDFIMVGDSRRGKRADGFYELQADEVYMVSADLPEEFYGEDFVYDVTIAYPYNPEINSDDAMVISVLDFMHHIRYLSIIKITAIDSDLHLSHADRSEPHVSSTPWISDRRITFYLYTSADEIYQSAGQYSRNDGRTIIAGNYNIGGVDLETLADMLEADSDL